MDQFKLFSNEFNCWPLKSKDLKALPRECANLEFVEFLYFIGSMERNTFRLKLFS